MPHGSSKDLLLADKSSAIAVTESKGQQCLHSDVTSEQLEKVIQQQAIYHFQRNAEATVYQMLWKYEHNTAYIQVEKASFEDAKHRKIDLGFWERKDLTWTGSDICDPSLRQHVGCTGTPLAARLDWKLGSQ